MDECGAFTGWPRFIRDVSPTYSGIGMEIERKLCRMVAGKAFLRLLALAGIERVHLVNL